MSARCQHCGCVPRKLKLSTEQEAEMCRLYAAGSSMLELASRFEVAVSHVHRLLHKNRVQVRPRYVHARTISPAAE